MSNPFDFNAIGPMLAGFQQKVDDLKEQAQRLEAEGQAGSGLVKVVANGKMEIVRVVIEADAMEDRELLEDLVTAAANDALRRAREVLAERVAEITGGLPLPPGLMGM